MRTDLRGAVLFLLLASSADAGLLAAPASKSRSLCEPTADPIIIDRLEAVSADGFTAGYVISESGHYALAGDLVVPDDVDVGILITGQAVFLSLRGHTIEEPRGAATVIRTKGERLPDNGFDEGASSLSICDGRLEGGATGIMFDGIYLSDLEMTGLQIDGMGKNAGFHAVVTEDVWTVRLEDSRIVAADTGVLLRNTRHWMIVGNAIEAGRVGLEGGFRGGEVSRNVIEAPLALRARKSIIRGNTLVGTVPEDGTATDTQCAVLLDEENIFESNLVTAREGAALCISSWNLVANNTLSSARKNLPEHLLRVEGSANLIVENRIGEARKSSVALSGHGNRLVGNDVFSNTTGVGVEGSYNLIEDNVIRGKKHMECGVDFGGFGGNVLRGNTGKGTIICGNPNVQLDDGSVSSLPGDSRAGPRPHSREARGGSNKKAEVVTLISDLEYAMDGFSRVGLRIDAPGRYLLTRSLTAVFIESAVLITAPDVILDLGGHTLKADQSGNVIEIRGAHDITVRNGVLDSGNGDGLSVEGIPGSGSRLTLENMRIHSGGSCATGVFIRDVDDVSISSSILGSNYGGVSISGAKTGRIADSVISTAEHGLRVSGSPQSRFEVVRNILIGGHGDAAADLRGTGNVIQGNVIATGDENPLTINSSNDLVSNNTILGGQESAVEVHGQGNRLDGNLIVGGTCGIQFEGSQHTFRRNIVMDVDEGVCGEPAQDDGENLIPPWGCGDGRRNEPEQCDLNDVQESCQDLGLGPGIMRCDANCEYDTSGCAVCGDGVRQPFEPCEGSDLGGRTCAWLGFYSGTLACGDLCTFDTSACAGRCGDGVLQAPERCDEWDFGGVTCASLGLGWGTLRCSPDCRQYDYSACY